MLFFIFESFSWDIYTVLSYLTFWFCNNESRSSVWQLTSFIEKLFSLNSIISKSLLSFLLISFKALYFWVSFFKAIYSFSDDKFAAFSLLSLLLEFYSIIFMLSRIFFTFSSILWIFWDKRTLFSERDLIFYSFCFNKDVKVYIWLLDSFNCSKNVVIFYLFSRSYFSKDETLFLDS